VNELNFDYFAVLWSRSLPAVAPKDDGAELETPLPSRRVEPALELLQFRITKNPKISEK